MHYYFENDLAYLYGAYEKLWDETYHASGLINLVDPFRPFVERQEGRQNALYKRRLGIAPRVANINDEWYPAKVEHGLGGS